MKSEGKKDGDTLTLEEVFRDFARREQEDAQVASLAAIILDQCTHHLKKDLERYRWQVTRGKKALQLLEMLRESRRQALRITNQEFFATKKLLWGAVVSAWASMDFEEINRQKEDRDLFADAVLSFKLIAPETFEVILREYYESRWLVCKLLERATVGSDPNVMAFMIRSILRYMQKSGDRDALLKIVHFIVGMEKGN